MADVSIPFHGDDRAKYFLAPGHVECVPVSPCSTVTLLAVVLATVLSISGCSGANVSPGEAPAERSDIQLLLEMVTDDKQVLPPVTFPSDLQSHPQAQAESSSIRAIVFDDTERAHSVYAQFDRFHLGDRAIEESAWSFDSVFRAAVAVGRTGEASMSTHELFERGALGLANSQEGALSVGSNELNIHEISASTGLCDAQVAFATRQVPQRAVTITSQIKDCPRVNSAGNTLNQWEAAAIAVSGDVSGSPVSGFAWLSHAWGQPPQPGGAVLLDQLRLRLVDTGGEISLLNANRTRRRSGKGPVTILAELVNAEGERTSIDLQWQDNSRVRSSATGSEYVAGIALSSNTLALQLDPVVPMAEVADTLGNRWAGAMQVSGSHKGVGFADIQPLTSSVMGN